MKYLITSFLLLNCLCVKSQIQTDIPLLKFEEVEEKIGNYNKGITVINFWSTTCAPCVKELPDFVEINEKYKNTSGFKMMLVSLDRSKDIDRVKRFLLDKKITVEVVILDDIKRMNTWIPRYDAEWGGEIPVTLFYVNGEKKLFHNGEISKEELDFTIQQYLN